MIVALVLAAVILVGHIADTAQFKSISNDARKLVLLGLLGGATVAALALLFHRRPDALPIVAVAVLPFRVPVAAAGSTANLLVPLYMVIAGGVGAYAWTIGRGLASKSLSRDPCPDPTPSG